MQTITIVFTKRANPVSFGIRWALPQTRFALARASHCLIVDGDHMIEANMLHGVRRVPAAEALKGAIEVDRIDFEVPDAEAGLRWARELAAAGADYDFTGAIGSVAPDRDWQDPADWFCFELAAMTIHKAGRTLFRNVAHISGTTLMAVEPRLLATC